MKKIQNFLRKRKLGYSRVERPLSLLVILWIVALLFIGGINKYLETGEEQAPMQGIQEEIKEAKEQNE